MSDTKLAVGAATNVLFWREVASSLFGRKYGWIGVAASMSAMVAAGKAKGPVVPLLNLPGSVAASVLGLRGCGCKDAPKAETEEPTGVMGGVIDPAPQGPIDDTILQAGFTHEQILEIIKREGLENGA